MICIRHGRSNDVIGKFIWIYASNSISTLVQVMGWCCQTASHVLCQCVCPWDVV